MAEWVDNSERLNRLVAHWAKAPLLALDTEFERSRTFYARLGLIQVADETGEYLLDPLSGADFSGFAELLSAQRPVKVVHACGEDLEVLNGCLGARLGSVFDTQWAAAFLGDGLQLGYRALVAARLGEELAKGEARSDWLQRPLSAEQLDYAAQDVRYLPALYRCLWAELADNGLSGWYEQDCRAILAGAYAPETTGYEQCPGAWQLSPRQLAVLEALWDWREAQARARDKPRRFLLKDDALVPLAQRQPRNRKALAPLMPAAQIRQSGDAVLECVERARARAESALPAPLPPPLPKAAKQVLQALRSKVDEEGARLGVPPQVLARRRQLQALLEAAVEAGPGEALARAWPSALAGWRYEALQGPLSEVLAGFSETLAEWRRQRGNGRSGEHAVRE